jgi:hypothetical protein
VDDNDPAVAYNGFTLEESLTEFEYQRTLHKSNGTFSTATFNFTGTAVEAYGSMRSSSDVSIPIISCYIDDGEARTTDSFATEGLVMTKLLLCGVTGLSDGPHTIRLEALTDFEFWVDFFIYTASSSDSSTSTSMLPAPTSSSSQSNKTSSAPIIGGVIGGVAGLALIVFLILFFKRHRQKSSTTLEEESQGRSMGHAPSSKSPFYASTTTSRNNTRRTLQQEDTLLSSNTSPISQTLSPLSRLFRDNQRQRDLGTGTGSSLPQEDTSTLQSPTSPRLAAPLPQKYSSTQANPAEILEHDPSSASAYTRDTRSPPPQYSN